MASTCLNVIGVIGILGGIAMTVLNKQVAAFILPKFKGKLDLWDAILASKAYQPTAS
jgi:hypothetical protein